MNLLIVTQKVDINDGVLGFMHRWLEKFAGRFERINVICLEQGQYNLPSNVKVWSLGKEGGRSRLKYLVRFYWYIYALRKDYDTVFVHMNKEYVVLGGLFWKTWGKKTVLWYNHSKGNIVSRIAGILVDRIAYTSPFSFFSKYGKAQKMPVGIDTELFKKTDGVKKEHSILCLGRIDPVKNIDKLIEAVKILDQKNVDFTLSVCGEPSQGNSAYYKKIMEMSSGLEQKGKIKFLSSVANYQTPEIYNQHEVFVNLTPSGSFDKTVIEAMSCEIPVIICNKSLNLPRNYIFKENDPADLAEKLQTALNLTENERVELDRSYRQIVVKEHSLDRLADIVEKQFYSL